MAFALFSAKNKAFLSLPLLYQIIKIMRILPKIVSIKVNAGNVEKGIEKILNFVQFFLYLLPALYIIDIMATE